MNLALTDFEARVFGAIALGATKFTAIDSKARPTYLFGFRKTDRALQRLRKLGKIKFDSKKGWSIVKWTDK